MKFRPLETDLRDPMSHRATITPLDVAIMSTLFSTEVTPNLMNFPPWQFVDYVQSSLFEADRVSASPQVASNCRP